MSKWDELPRPTDAEYNEMIARNKMTTGKWLFTVFALLIVGFVFDGTGKIVAAALIVAGVLISLAIGRWAHPVPQDD